MKKPFLVFLVLIFALKSYAQTKDSVINYTQKVEDYILYDKLDSARIFIKNIKNKHYKTLLTSIINKDEVSYSDYYEFTSSLSNRPSIKYLDVSNYIDKNIKPPVNSKKIELDYFNIKWVQVYKLRDDISLDKASVKQKELDDYLNSFNETDIDVVKAKLKASTHQLVMYQIQHDVKNGKQLCLDNLKKAEELKDKSLQIIFLYHLSDFLIEERKLQEYIDISEKSLQLEKELPKTTSYYHATIEHLINAYNFKGGHNDRVMELIDILYNNDSRRINSYSLYAQLVSGLPKNSPILKTIFKKFGVKDVPELTSKFNKLGKDLNSNDKYHLINYCSNALEAHGHLNLALRFKEKSVDITRKIYSQELSESLANFKTDIAVKEKEKEISHEKEKTKLYAIIAILAVLFLIIALFVLNKIKKQSKELKEKNTLIKKTLKEKDLLVREVHHRVKNNFQIVSSLLELQTKGIEDEKALELANEGKNRVKSMALIHQKLYQNESGLIDFDEYIRLLIKELSSLYSSNNNVKTSISSENMMFDVDTAIPLGLIINEIITNSYKYAFKNDKENNLSILIQKDKDNDYKLVIEDNGPGLSKSLDVKKAKSLGLRLVNRLVKQLHGTLNQTNDSGARFEIYFKDSNTRQLVN